MLAFKYHHFSLIYKEREALIAIIPTSFSASSSIKNFAQAKQKAKKDSLHPNTFQWSNRPFTEASLFCTLRPLTVCPCTHPSLKVQLRLNPVVYSLLLKL